LLLRTQHTAHIILVDWLPDWLIGWFTGYLIGWLTGYLIGWLVGWLTCQNPKILNFRFAFRDKRFDVGHAFNHPSSVLERLFRYLFDFQEYQRKIRFSSFKVTEIFKTDGWPH
jgi:beta-lactamase class D